MTARGAQAKGPGGAWRPVAGGHGKRVDRRRSHTLADEARAGAETTTPLTRPVDCGAPKTDSRQTTNDGGSTCSRMTSLVPSTRSPPLPLPLSPSTGDAAPVWSLVQAAAATVDGLAALALSALATTAQASVHGDDVDRYMTGGAYDLALDRAVAVGHEAITARISALCAHAEASGLPMPTPVVVFDVDDTLLSTHPQRRLQFGAAAEAGRDVIAGDESEFLPPLEPVVRLYRQLLADGARTAIVTGRWATDRHRTLANLYRVAVGGWDHALFRTAGSSDAHLSARAYKEHQRARLTAAGYEIVGVVGDQHSDMAYGVPGVVNIKLPNPAYTTY